MNEVLRISGHTILDRVRTLTDFSTSLKFYQTHIYLSKLTNVPENMAN